MHATHLRQDLRQYSKDTEQYTKKERHSIFDAKNTMSAPSSPERGRYKSNEIDANVFMKTVLNMCNANNIIEDVFFKEFHALIADYSSYTMYTIRNKHNLLTCILEKVNNNCLMLALRCIYTLKQNQGSVLFSLIEQSIIVEISNRANILFNLGATVYFGEMHNNIIISKIINSILDCITQKSKIHVFFEIPCIEEIPISHLIRINIDFHWKFVNINDENLRVTGYDSLNIQELNWGVKYNHQLLNDAKVDYSMLESEKNKHNGNYKIFSSTSKLGMEVRNKLAVAIMKLVSSNGRPRIVLGGACHFASPFTRTILDMINNKYPTLINVNEDFEALQTTFSKDQSVFNFALIFVDGLKIYPNPLKTTQTIVLKLN